MSKDTLDWWRCFGCGRKVPEADAVFVKCDLRGLDGELLEQAWHAECLGKSEWVKS